MTTQAPPEASLQRTEVVKQPIKPAWWRESSVYQIYPASFKCSTPGSNHGDLRGIISELDYIKALGVDIVWLSPILASPQVDMGYDISDYKDIHRPYGTMADHDDLIKGLHDRGLKYVMDLVVNHTSDQHEWFQASRSSKDNPYRDWYFWRPPRYTEQGERIPPNNWESAFSGSAWEWDEHTQEYYLHLFAKEQPDLNWENPAVVEAVHNIIRFWLERGVDGFRMDVINFISKTPGLPDGAIQRPGFLQSGIEHFACGPRLHEFFQGIGKILQEYDAFSVGEMPGVTDTREILKAVGQDRGELAMAFQFEIVDMDHEPESKWLARKFTPRELKRIVNKWQKFMLDNAGWNAIYTENHDQSRTISRYCDDSDQYRSKSAKMLASHLALQSGTLFVYQGQELAQINVPETWPLDEYKDIEMQNHWNTVVLREYADDMAAQAAFKKQYRLIGRDNARTPMQWTPTAEDYAGFLPSTQKEASLKPWMSIHPDFPQWNAQTLLADPSSPLHYWRRLLATRKSLKHVFVYGDFDMLDLDHETVVAYLRTAATTSTSTSTSTSTQQPSPQKSLIMTNFSGEVVPWRVPATAVEILCDPSTGTVRPGAIVEELRNYVDEGDNVVRRTEDGGCIIELRPWEVVVAVS